LSISIRTILILCLVLLARKRKRRFKRISLKTIIRTTRLGRWS